MHRDDRACWPTPLTTCALGTAGSTGPDRLAHYAYDNANRTTVVAEAYGVTGQARATVTTSYTANGQVATVKDAKSNLTTYAYDGLDRLATIFYPSPSTINSSSTTDYEQRGYDLNSNVTSLRTRSAATIGISYDALGRLSSSGTATAMLYDGNDLVAEYASSTLTR